MKTVKILIATAILSTSFYACKKDEMNIQPGEVKLESRSQNKLGAEGAMDATNGMIKVIFNRVGTMIIEGNPNLEKLLNMYNASGVAIASANTIFENNPQNQLSIIFDKDGIAIASDVPKVQIGSSIDAFIFQFCNLKPTAAMTLSISKNNITRNFEEFWNALPEGANQKFLSQVRNLQDELPMNYSLQVSFTENQNPSIIYLDENGNPQPVLNPTQHCNTNGTGWISDLACALFSWL
jgi:hypothetical protein